jgi:hypothetical protein
MLCWSCNKEIAETAKFCPHCEAEVMEEPPAEEVALVANFLSNLSPANLDELREAFENCESGEDFVNRIMVGDCPKCASSNTGNCENDPEIDDICVARCLDCGQLWCPDCGEFFEKSQSIQHDCPAWEDMPDDEE